MENSPALIDGLEVLEKRLLTKDRVFTVGDAAAITGYRTDHAKQLLDRLIAKYDCKLKITEDGDLIYDFGNYPHKRGERTWGEWWHGVRKWAWKAFMLFFKIWIAVTLVVYFALFLLILIAIVLAALAGDKDSDKKTDIGDGFGSFFRVLADIFVSAFRWETHYRTTHYVIGEGGYEYREYDHRRSPTHKDKKSFVASVYDYVFGPERVEISPLANQMEAGAYIRSQKGLIIVPEIIALAGWKGGEAENFLAQLVAHYQGEAKISNQSLLYGDFTDFARQKTTDGAGKVIWYWDEYEPEYKLTGNGFWRNFWITFMCAFNLAFAGFFSAAHLNPDMSGLNISPEDTLVFVFLGWIPLAFSVIFFSVPLLRWWGLGALRHKRKLSNIRKRLMKAIYLSDKEVMTLKELQSIVNNANNVERLTEAEVSHAMNELILDFYGDLDIGGDGNAVYKFTRLREELREVRQLRGGQDTQMSRVVFESE